MMNPADPLQDLEFGKDNKNAAVGAPDLDWITATMSRDAVQVDPRLLPYDPTAPPPAPASGGLPPLCGVLSITFYQKYFNVDTTEVRDRMSRSVFPFGPLKFSDSVGGNPDLYGPFWICATLVFIIGVTSNMASWMSLVTPEQLQQWHYDFTLMTFAGVVVFGFVTCVPTAAWFAMRYYGLDFGLTQLLCLYGYSVLVFIPAALACLFASAVFDWVCFSLAVGTSAHLIISNSLPVIMTQSPNLSRVVRGSLAGVQVAFGLLLKLYFFRRV